jgi:hypothetical protein
MYIHPDSYFDIVKVTVFVVRCSKTWVRISKKNLNLVYLKHTLLRAEGGFIITSLVVRDLPMYL